MGAQPRAGQFCSPGPDLPYRRSTRPQLQSLPRPLRAVCPRGDPAMALAKPSPARPTLPLGMKSALRWVPGAAGRVTGHWRAPGREKHPASTLKRARPNAGFGLTSLESDFYVSARGTPGQCGLYQPCPVVCEAHRGPRAGFPGLPQRPGPGSGGPIATADTQPSPCGDDRAVHPRSGPGEPGLGEGVLACVSYTALGP